MIDKKGTEIEVGANAFVDGDGSFPVNDFYGEVTYVNGNDADPYVTVVDQEDNAFDVHPKQIEIDVEDECKVDSDGCLRDNDGDAETDMENRGR